MKPLLKAFILFFIFSMGVCAEVQEVYTSHVPVSSQSQAVLQEAQEEALVQVLQRVTLQADVTATKESLLSEAPVGQYIQSYAYEKNTSNSDLPWTLVANFDGKKINQLLLDWQIPIIGNNRPVLLALISVNDAAGNRVLMGQQSAQEDYQFLAQSANDWGIPLVFPANDLTDLQNFQLHDVASFDLQRLAPGAKRYKANGLLVGEINNLGNGSFASKWKMVFGDNAFQWQLSGESVTEMLQLSLNNVVKNYANLFSITSDDEQVVEIEVYGISSLSQIKSLADYLTNVDSVARVIVQTVESGEVVLAVSTIGGVQVFVDSLAADGKLKLVDSDFSQQSAKLSFTTGMTSNEK
jgi:uncharacterized protein